MIVDGALDDAGSREFIARFLLGAGISREACFSFIAAKEPRVTDIENATTTALNFWEGEGLTLCPDPVLGMGLTGIVIAMVVSTLDGDEADASGQDIIRVLLGPAPIFVWIFCVAFYR